MYLNNILEWKRFSHCKKFPFQFIIQVWVDVIVMSTQFFFALQNPKFNSNRTFSQHMARIIRYVLRAVFWILLSIPCLKPSYAQIPTKNWDWTRKHRFRNYDKWHRKMASFFLFLFAFTHLLLVLGILLISSCLCWISCQTAKQTLMIKSTVKYDSGK